jgi:hypothetical protein
VDDYTGGGSLLPAASAAAALAQLHGHKIEQDWDSEGVSIGIPSTTPDFVFLVVALFSKVGLMIATKANGHSIAQAGLAFRY